MPVPLQNEKQGHLRKSKIKQLKQKARRTAGGKQRKQKSLKCVKPCKLASKRFKTTLKYIFKTKQYTFPGTVSRDFMLNAPHLSTEQNLEAFQNLSTQILKPQNEHFKMQILKGMKHYEERQRKMTRRILILGNVCKQSK